tara:strand:- start:511 stop:1284 length:774 start_codon:yes stop_codon:yes gene_type:complete
MKLSDFIDNLPRYMKIYLAEIRLSVKLALKGRVHQYQEVKSLRKFLRDFEVDCVIDVGANHGQYATMLRRDVGFRGLILSFEPGPDMFQSLSKKTSGEKNWHAYHLAFSDESGTVPFNIMEGDQLSSINKTVDDLPEQFRTIGKIVETVDVQAVRLEELYPQLKAEHGFGRPFLKLDTQGHDLMAAKGAERCLAEMLGVQTELAVQKIYSGATGYRDMIDWLEERQFVPSAFFANNRGHFPLLFEMDGIFVSTSLLD